MATIQIDFDIYLPAPSTYYNYLELLKAHNFVKTDKNIEQLIQNFTSDIEKFEDVENAPHSTSP